MKYVDPVHLRQVLTQYYNEGELRTMCFDLAIDYESLGGRGKSEKVAELVLYARRNNRIDDIASYVRRTRSHVQLKMTDTPPPSPAAADSHSQPSSVTHVYGDYVGGDKVGGDKVGGDKVSGDKTEAGRDVIMTGGGDYAGHDMTKQSAGGDLYSAGGDININANPQDKAEFIQTLNAVKKLLEEAIANGEFEDDRDGEDALKEMQEITEEANSEEPRPRSIKRNLGNLADILGDATKVAEAAGKAGTAVLKATPIIAGLIKAASVIF